MLQLCRIDQSLLTNGTQPFALSHGPFSPSQSTFADSTTYALAFDLAVPGWLPASSDNEMSSTSYGIVCEAVIGWSDTLESDTHCTSGSEHICVPGNQTPISSLPIPIGTGFSAASRFLPRLAKTVANAFSASSMAQYSHESTRITKSEWKAVRVVRHRAPPAMLTMFDSQGGQLRSPVATEDVPLRHFTLKPSEDSPSPIECVVSTPEILDLNGPSLKVSLRLRARKMAVPSPEPMDTDEPRPMPAGFMRSSDEHGDVAMSEPFAGSEEDYTHSTASSPRESPRKTRTTPRPAVVEDPVRMVELGMEVEEVERYK